MYVRSPAVLKWIFIPPFQYSLDKQNVTFYGHTDFKNIKDMRNRIWHLIFIEDSTGHKRKTNKKSGDKDEKLLDIMPYATMTEITSLNSTIPNSIEFMLYVVRTQLFFFFYPFPYILEVYYIYFDRFTPDWQPVT